MKKIKQKNSMPIENYKKLCDFNGEKYVSKKGLEYINALDEVFTLININDRPFLIEDIKKQPRLEDFKFDGINDFHFICKLKASPLTIDKKGYRINEKILAYNFVNDNAKEVFNKSLGVAYILTAVFDNVEYIIKIGSSRTTFKKRLGSYNCGVVNNWRTASTTNIKILQSFVTTRAEFNLYLYDCSEELVVTNDCNILILVVK